MKITTEDNMEQFVLSKVKTVCIKFDDDVEVKLNNIIEYDIDLDNVECSAIDFLDLLNNTELENRFRGRKSNHISFIHIEAIGIFLDDYYGKEINVFYDIPCDMKIRRLRIDGRNRDDIGNMFISIEGFVK